MSKPSSKTLIEESTGKPTKLKEGYGFVYFIQNKTLAISSENGRSRILWPSSHGDDKTIANFIKDKDDFLQFANILASTHGLCAVEEVCKDFIGIFKCKLRKL